MNAEEIIAQQQVDDSEEEQMGVDADAKGAGEMAGVENKKEEAQDETHVAEDGPVSADIA